MKHYITIKQLNKLDACYDKVALVRQLFGSRVELTRANIRKFCAAGAALSDWSWLAACFFTCENYIKFSRSRRRYVDSLNTTDISVAAVIQKCGLRFLALYLKEKGE
jgi:hypothetical protein